MAKFQCKNYMIIRNLDGIENSFENLLRALQECIFGEIHQICKIFHEYVHYFPTPLENAALS